MSGEEAALAAMMRERITELEAQVAGLERMNTEKAAEIRRLQSDAAGDQG